MIERIKKQRHLNLSKSFMIGDQETDEIAAANEISGLYFEYAKKDFIFNLNL